MRRISRIVAAVAAGLLALTGCAWSKASVGVQVGDTVISAASIDAAADAVIDVLAKNGRTFTRAQANSVAIQDAVLGAVIENERAAGTLTFPQAAVDSLVGADPVLSQLAANPATAKLAQTEGFLGAMQADTTLAGQLQAGEAKVKVELNPRYGLHWVPGQGVANADGSLSLPAPVR